MKVEPKVINNIGYTISLCGIVEAHITSGVTALFIDSDDVATMVEPLILMNDRLRLEQCKLVEIPFGNPMPEYYFRLEPHRLIKTSYWVAMPVFVPRQHYLEIRGILRSMEYDISNRG